MNQRKSILKEGSRMLWSYLFYTFVIAWVAELLLIACYRLNLFDGNIALLHFAVIGFGAAFA